MKSPHIYSIEHCCFPNSKGKNFLKVEKPNICKFKIELMFEMIIYLKYEFTLHVLKDISLEILHVTEIFHICFLILPLDGGTGQNEF